MEHGLKVYINHDHQVGGFFLCRIRQFFKHVIKKGLINIPLLLGCMPLVRIHFHKDRIFVDWTVEDVIVFLHSLFDHCKTAVQEEHLEKESIRIAVRLPGFDHLVSPVEKRKDRVVFYRFKESLSPQLFREDLCHSTFSCGDNSCACQQNSAHPLIIKNLWRPLYGLSLLDDNITSTVKPHQGFSG